MPTQYLNVKEVAARYGVEKSTVWRWRKAGALPEPKKFGPQTLRWSLEDLVEHEKAVVQ